jgi:glyoxylase I family protein
MAIKFENVGIAVRDIEAAIAFFTDLGLTLIGRDTVSGEWTDTAVGLDGNHANIAMLQTPDGHGRLELFEYIHPKAIESNPTRPNDIGMHRVAFSVDDIDKALDVAAKHGCHPLRGVATYKDVYKLTYLRGPSGIPRDARRGTEERLTPESRTAACCAAVAAFRSFDCRDSRSRSKFRLRRFVRRNWRWHRLTVTLD